MDYVASRLSGKETMERIALKIRLLDRGRGIPLPDYESEGSSGIDLRAAVQEDVMVRPGEIKLIPTGLAVSIPRGYEGQIRPRSGLALKYGIGVANSPGTIDSDYRGEIGIILINWGKRSFTVKRGDRIAQLVISKVCRADMIAVEDLDSTPRGEGGFGHSGIE
jgi:dUTP pyrophosphatase